jgi:phosphoribosyl 1,2-cyclic phosphate phosphodiesterase
MDGATRDLTQPDEIRRHLATPEASGSLLFLGTGTSHGVPMIGCECAVCTSDDPRDTRTRPSVYLTLPGGVGVLIDTAPDFRTQALRHRVPRVDAVLYTHSHADHVLGLDDLRRYNHLQRTRIPCYGDAQTIHEVRRTFSYIFDRATPAGGGLPEIDLFPVHGAFSLGGVEIVPVPLWHGRRLLYGYRIGGLAYLTDCSAIPEESWALLEGVQVVVVDALRHRPHPTHFTVAEALEVVTRLAPSSAWFTHICHDLPHVATGASLPEGVELAYDGLSVTFTVTPAVHSAKCEAQWTSKDYEGPGAK